MDQHPFPTVTTMDTSQLIADVFALSTSIRYVAVRNEDRVDLQGRPDLSSASSGDSDWYEETLVNPTLLTLTTQRGNIDCGGLRYVIVGYGNFTQLVIPIGGTGHISIAFELGSNPLQHLEAIARLAS
jgi:hypothetical protein